MQSTWSLTRDLEDLKKKEIRFFWHYHSLWILEREAHSTWPEDQQNTFLWLRRQMKMGKKWEQILNKCSLDLLLLIIEKTKAEKEKDHWPLKLRHLKKNWWARSIKSLFTESQKRSLNPQPHSPQTSKPTKWENMSVTQKILQRAKSMTGRKKFSSRRPSNFSKVKEGFPPPAWESHQTGVTWRFFLQPPRTNQRSRATVGHKRTPQVSPSSTAFSATGRQWSLMWVSLKMKDRCWVRVLAFPQLTISTHLN